MAKMEFHSLALLFYFKKPIPAHFTIFVFLAVRELCRLKIYHHSTVRSQDHMDLKSAGMFRLPCMDPEIETLTFIYL
jgi:hypothetical protein